MFHLHKHIVALPYHRKIHCILNSGGVCLLSPHDDTVWVQPDPANS